ncbi:hypothetical protein PM082_012273 [Marasmius tenuissimus]|nr:hypothetical protein PM082_012273 [Marasmius tenuissimus]
MSENSISQLLPSVFTTKNPIHKDSDGSKPKAAVATSSTAQTPSSKVSVRALYMNGPID